MNYSIEKVTALIGAHRYGDLPSTVGFLLTDSRSLCFPEETLFFALKSERNDGHRYIDELYRRGVRNFVVEKVPDNYALKYPDGNFLKVLHPLEALQRLAERHRDEFRIPIIGITGSNGKTILKEWLYQVLSGVGCLPTQDAQPTTLSPLSVTRSPKSYNSQIGVPLSVWLLHEQTQVGIFEAGISKKGEMEALRDIIQPTIGVITNIGTAHQENFESVDEKCQEKLKLFKDAQVVFYSASDPVIARHIGELKCKIIPYHAWEGELPFIDKASKENAGACAAVAEYVFNELGVRSEELGVVAGRLKRLEPVAMRLEVKEGQHGCTLINDSYNSDINSLDIALDFMNRRPDHKGRKRTLILSDIYQSGMAAEELYRDVSLLCEKRGVEKFIGIGPEITAQAAQINIFEKYFFASCEEFIGSGVFGNLKNEVILLKGARPFGFDGLTELLEQKVHETILAVNLNALVDNLNYYRSFMRPETKIVCMVKADAYGAGAVEVAKTLQDHRVDYLAVAVADEGVTLRKAGITQNIMIMNPEMTSFKTMFDYELEPEVYSFRLLDALIKAARKEGITGYPVHIKLDTGMHRLGFGTLQMENGEWRMENYDNLTSPVSAQNAADNGHHNSTFNTLHSPLNEIDRLIDILQHQQAVVPRSVFSHFVGSDSADFDEFSALQFERFDKASKRLQAAFPHRILRHMDNSAGIEHFPERQLDMCRLGIGLYGVDSIDNRILNTVSTLKTTILQMRRVPKEDTVGYSRKGVLTRDSVIAAIPIGYADGLNRHLGRGRCYCLVNGKRAPYVGNICMDVAMIDVTGIDCQEGDTVEIFGDHLPVTVLADCLDTIPYEVLTGISSRVKRVYFQD